MSVHPLPRYALRLALSLAAFALSWWSIRTHYLSVPTGADENSYVFQAHSFSEGLLRRPAPPLLEPFQQEMIILDGRAGWVSRYPPAHPLWLAPGAWAGDVYLMIALAASLGMWFLCAAARAAQVPEGFAGLPLLLSPYFGFMYGTQLSHTSGFVAAAAMLWAYLRWKADGRSSLAVVAGLAWSALFLNRTWTALLMAAPFGVDALLHGWRQKSWPVWKGVLLFAGGAGTGVAGYLLYNALITGHPLLATYLYYAPSENLGFGPRRTQGMTIHHTLAKGLANGLSDLVLLNRWLLGFTGSLAAWGALAAAGWTRRLSALLAASVLSVWLGYVYFWFPGVRNAGGPVYWFETLPALILLGALGLHRLWRMNEARPRMRRSVAIYCFVLLAVVSGHFTLRESPRFQKEQRAKRDLLDTLRSAPPRSIVFIEDFKTPHMGEIVFNPRGLDSDPLLLRSSYSGNVVPMRVFAERTPFLLRGGRPGVLEPMERAERIERGRDARNLHRNTGEDRRTGPGPSDVVRVAEEGDAEGYLGFGRNVSLPRGRYTTVVHATWEDIVPERPSRIEIHSRAEGRVVALRVFSGDSQDDSLRFPLAVEQAADDLEPRIHYGGSGTLKLRRIEFLEQP